jgi:hypothetical protein
MLVENRSNLVHGIARMNRPVVRQIPDSREATHVDLRVKANFLCPPVVENIVVPKHHVYRQVTERIGDLLHLLQCLLVLYINRLEPRFPQVETEAVIIYQVTDHHDPSSTPEVGCTQAVIDVFRI